MRTTNYRDSYGWNSGNGATTDTGTTSQTSQGNDLWIGATTYSVGTYGQTNPTNGFTLLDGQLYSSVSLGYLEYISPSVGYANSGTQNSGYTAWSGVIASFKGTVVDNDDIYMTPMNGRSMLVLEAEPISLPRVSQTLQIALGLQATMPIQQLVRAIRNTNKGTIHGALALGQNYNLDISSAL